MGSESLTNASNSGTSATPNTFSGYNLSSEYLTNASNLGTSSSPNSFSASDLTSATPNFPEKSVKDKLIESKTTLGEKRKCETTRIQTDFKLDANTETLIKRKKQGVFKSFENQTDAVEAAFMFHEKESRKGPKNTKKEKKRSRSR